MGPVVHISPPRQTKAPGQGYRPGPSRDGQGVSRPNGCLPTGPGREPSIARNERTEKRERGGPRAGGAGEGQGLPRHARVRGPPSPTVAFCALFPAQGQASGGDRGADLVDEVRGNRVVVRV